MSSFQLTSSKSAILDQLLDARATCQQYVDRFEAGERNAGLIFVGPPGVGKTHLAVAVLVEILERCAIPGRFVELTSFINQLQATFVPTAPETTQDVLAPLMEAPLLVLDELGAQQPTPWLRDVLYLVINARYTKRLPTLFTTNYRLQVDQIRASPKNHNLDRGADPEPVKAVESSPALLSTRLPAMLVSRLHEMTQAVLLIDVDDYRRKQARENQRRMKSSKVPTA
jgi:DNA replication protein DnaC